MLLVHKNLDLWQFFGFVFSGVFGTVLHFLYIWTKKSVLVAPFSAINESTWEHMKILFFPMFIFSFIECYVFCNTYDNFWCVKAIGILTGLILIPVLFYTYLGIFGKSTAWFNIFIFFIADAAAYFVEAILFRQEFSCADTICLLFLCIIALLFGIFTFYPPKIPLFQDPISGNYGIPK